MAIKKVNNKMSPSPKKPVSNAKQYTTKPVVTKTTYTRGGVTFVKNPDGTYSKK